MYAFLNKNMSYTENQSIYFQTKKVSGVKQVPASEDKRIRRQGGDLKSDAKRWNIISYNHIGLW
jgi:hypothetical protein